MSNEATHVRVWTARIAHDRVDDYVDVVRRGVLPHLADTEGYVGALFLVHGGGEERDLVVLTRWESAEAAGALGDEPLSAFIPDAVRDTLVRADETVEIYEVLLED